MSGCQTDLDAVRVVAAIAHITEQQLSLIVITTTQLTQLHIHTQRHTP